MFTLTVNLKIATKYEMIQQQCADIDEEENRHIHLDTRQINILNIKVVGHYLRVNCNDVSYQFSK